MNKNLIAYIMLVIAWPVTIVHRYWNSLPAREVHWYVFEKDRGIDIQWYIYDVGDAIAITLILAAFLLIAENKPIKLLLRGMFAVAVIELLSYVLFAKHNELLLYIQGAILLYCTLKSLFEIVWKKKQQ